ncbi:pirin family protein [Marinitenerispora sediminis]|uniref:Pirin n=1 Tax=Marinitenerispora sediminis TaxID=1931232 RepID=A0A368T395_9ACTN|nr:pirin family protein [Marinitenerispora sediminis]RCV49372.1 pirin [Marinitenerispora sediminis]RCV55991.1 pirin [Marinitenerispora sediminis]RCV56606.1 pirin [Marinitenerispora sediminis]
MTNPEARPAPRVCTEGGLPGPWAECEGRAPVEIISARAVPLGGPRAMNVRRTLPQRQRSLIGAWCFVDHYGPDDVAATGGMDVAPHPHTGLQTVSWLFEGAITHNDSGGNRADVLPGEMNLMTAGAGICHSETSDPATGRLHGVQLWLALPEGARHTAERAFEHFVPDPVEFPGGYALVFLGSLLDSRSPVGTYTPLVGAELRLASGAEIDLEVDPAFEHGLLVDTGESVTLEGVHVPKDAMGYTGVGSGTLRIANGGGEPARLVLLGGAPFGEEVVMWWNFLGRSTEEIRQYREEWENHGERFGRVEGYVGHGGPGRNRDGMARIPAPELPQVPMRPRRNPAPHVQFDG